MEELEAGGGLVVHEVLVGGEGGGGVGDVVSVVVGLYGEGRAVELGVAAGWGAVEAGGEGRHGGGEGGDGGYYYAAGAVVEGGQRGE